MPANDSRTYARERVSSLETFPTQAHDVTTVSNHVDRETDAVITDDGRIHEHYVTLWD